MSFLPAGSRGGYPFPADEVALIVWDPAQGMEHFIRQARFADGANDFAFIVPVPSTPEIAEAPAQIFGWIYDRVYERTDSERAGRGFGGGGGEGDKAPVYVLKEQEVAGLNAVVIKSTDPRALVKWLEKNGYATPKEALSWIQTYVDRDWQFVAFKIKAKTAIDARAASVPDKADKPNKLVASPFVRLSFRTPRAFFPYRESELRRKIPGREFSLFVIAPTPTVGSYESIKPWTTYHSYSVPMSLEGKTPMPRFLRSLLKKPKNASDRLFITHFRNNEERRPFDEDLYFDASAL